MIITMKKDTPEQEIKNLMESIEAKGVKVTMIQGTNYNVFGLVGDTTVIDDRMITANPYVDNVKRIAAPYKKANRLFHPLDSVIDVDGIKVGGKEKIVVIGGPCSVEGEESVMRIAKAVKEAGGCMLRGGAYKPRTSPYSFQGLKYEGLNLLNEAKAETGLPIVTELMSPYDIDTFVEKADIIQVGARNMQNFDLLKELGKIDKPILLKRGLSATIEELLMSAEYIMAGGNEKVILCERGIRTFETYTRNTLDLSVVPAIKKLSHLPVVIDPSHSAGKWWMVEPLAKAAVAVGADGLIIEVHNDPQKALCDRQQSIKPDVFAKLMEELKLIAVAIGREI